MDQEKLTERNEDQANTIWGQVKILFIVFIVLSSWNTKKLNVKKINMFLY
jgi:hypothetical protein